MPNKHAHESTERIGPLRSRKHPGGEPRPNQQISERYTVYLLVSDTRRGTYVICPDYLQAGAYPAELHAHGRSHSDSN
jgi:hypothetical protein